MTGKSGIGLHRFARERFAKGLSLAHHIVIAIQQFDIFGREYFEIIIDHCEELEVKLEYTA
jgi:hypothetical protein